MKKVKKELLILVLLLGSFMFVGCTSSEKINKGETIEYSYDEIKEEVIRFHVLANSDSKEDQEVKLKVRDEVIKYLEPLLKESKTLEESRKILKDNDKKIIEISKKVLKENGFNYSVKTEFKNENFPEKVYGNIVLPQGEYEAYRILIGNAEGQNWWCVMFPPLCFVDVTKGEVAYDETEKRMEEALKDDKEKEKIIFEDKKQEVNVKFKVVEVFENIFSN